MKTLTATQAQENFYTLFDEAISSHQPIRIIGDVGGAVLISAKVYKEMTEAIYSSSK
jgi:PHD/YefM family antitoxin component YafN of YafNO toxin-antitoxin module